ncbi:osmotically inducible protein OsmC [candidate division KSB1 bacterium]|nr:osmotically inducible protein OsmC [candidate division KSB1 bacterium]
MNASVKLVNGLSMMGKASSNHWVPMDAEEKVGGEEAASRPVELLLLGLGGCTGMDVVSIMKKKRVPFVDFEIDIEAERAEEHPRIYTKIKLTYKVYGKNIKEKDVERAIELSETKYCPASAMLRKSADIETTYEIIEK